jgi:ParB family chromosome partitioning protein
MTNQQTIPLHQLVQSKANVRHTGATLGIDALAASIAAHGLRQNLNVIPTADGRRFAVVAGQRRLRALRLLAKAGLLPRNAPIACLVLDDGDDPAEISLAENTLRTAMHPDDQCEAFRMLIEQNNLSIEDVAARFGVTAAVVRQRLKLANVSPKLRALYRKGEMGAEHVMALAISDDHARQEEAWANLPDWNREPSQLKRILTHEAVPLTDKLARFVGVDAYVAAGGVVLRDLFDDEDAGYLPDRDLLTRLATEKMQQAISALQMEGWKWVRPELTRNYSIAYGHVPCSTGEEDGDDEIFTPEDKQRSGARVCLDHDATLRIERGLIHPDDAKAERRREQGIKQAGRPAGLSAAMVSELTAHRTAALGIELARNPAVALASVVHALALPLCYGESSTSCLKLRAQRDARERYAQAHSDRPAAQALAEAADHWRALLPPDPAALFAWCLAQPQETLLELLAYLAGQTVDAVESSQGRNDQTLHADELAHALALDMRQWWTPGTQDFWQRLPKAALAQAVEEADVPPLGVCLAKLSKTEAVRVVAGALDGTGWLPVPLRAVPPALP